MSVTEIIQAVWDPVKMPLRHGELVIECEEGQEELDAYKIKQEASNHGSTKD